jgi:hypothetical protein
MLNSSKAYESSLAVKELSAGLESTIAPEYSVKTSIKIQTKTSFRAAFKRKIS